MKINTLAIVAFTALCAHHSTHGMLCISKLRSLAPLYTQTRRSYAERKVIWNIADYEDSLIRESREKTTRWAEEMAEEIAEKKIEAAKQAEQNKLASERRQLLQSRLDELQANLKKENQTIEKMSVDVEKAGSYYLIAIKAVLLMHSKNSKFDLEKEIFSIKALLIKD